MFFLVATGQDRPSIMEGKKDDNYHLKFARYCVGQANNQYQTTFIENTYRNKNFYKGNQWVRDEDLESFFKDDSNQERNRIKIVKNMIRPMVEQYRGNAIRMTLNYRVKSISPQAINRREEQLSKMLFISKIANQPGNPFGEGLRKANAIGKDEPSTTAIFDNLYQDAYVRKMNYLLKFVSERCQFEDKQVVVAENLALSGLAVIKNYEYAGHQEFKVVPSENFFFDRSAKEYDLTDGEFMGEVLYLSPSEIFEMYPDISQENKDAIDKYANQFRNNTVDSFVSGNTGSNATNRNAMAGKVPVYITYWRDGEQYEYGYVKDEFGYDYLTKINFVHEGEEKPRYTDADLIQSNSERAKRVLNGKLKRKRWVDTLRTCHFIPSEIMGSPTGVEKAPDIILDWGLAPYQETEMLEENSVKFPYKCYCWGYIDGEIFSPVDDAISPQRFINRVLSVAENQINNSRGSGTIYDKSILDPDGGEDEFNRNMNQSKPIGVWARGKGLQNVVGTYDGTIKNGTLVMFQLADMMKGYMQDVTGVNEALKGESTGSDQLVGVTQLMIQRGSLMQEPFYNAISKIFKQCAQAVCTTGKRIYADNERNLAIAAGDEGSKIIRITRDMKLEDFRCFIKRENSDEILVNAGNQLLFQLKEFGLIDDKRFANLYGRSTPDEIGTAIREVVKEKEELQRMQSEKMEQENQQMQQQEENMASQRDYMLSEAQAREDVKELDNREHDMKKEHLKALSKIAPNNAKAQQAIIDGAKNLENSKG